MISDLHRQRYNIYYKGKSIIARPHAWQSDLDAFVKECDAETVLDYGSGPSCSLEAYAPYPVTSYDPGVPHLADPPKPADVVVCNHTLEHVEPEMIDAVLQHIKSLTKKGVFIAVSCEPSTKVLFDGAPWHSLVRDDDWWEAKLREHFADGHLVYTKQVPSAGVAEFVWIRE